MPTDKRPLKVFLCHASADKPKVRELYRYLRRRGIRPWFDEIDLVGGQDWQIEIPKALITSDAIIICLTKNSVDKEGYVQKEIKFALDKALEMPEGQIFLIPVRFEECDVPFSLTRFQWVDLFDEASYARMMRALKFRASQLERATFQLPKKEVEEKKLVSKKATREKNHSETTEKIARERKQREQAEKAALPKLERGIAEQSFNYPWARLRGMQEFMEFARDSNWKPTLVDISLLKRLGMAISKEYAVIQALRFLGVIDVSGAPTKEFDNLKRDYQGIMKKLVLEKYKELFRLIPPHSMNQSSLVKFFGSAADTSEYQAKLFVWFCEQAGIELPNLNKHSPY
jgi:hypothetical protein